MNIKPDNNETGFNRERTLLISWALPNSLFPNPRRLHPLQRYNDPLGHVVMARAYTSVHSFTNDRGSLCRQLCPVYLWFPIISYSWMKGSTSQWIDRSPSGAKLRGGGNSDGGRGEFIHERKIPAYDCTCFTTRCFAPASAGRLAAIAADRKLKFRVRVCDIPACRFSPTETATVFVVSRNRVCQNYVRESGWKELKSIFRAFFLSFQQHSCYCRVHKNVSVPSTFRLL